MFSQRVPKSLRDTLVGCQCESSLAATQSTRSSVLAQFEERMANRFVTVTVLADDTGVECSSVRVGIALMGVL